MRETRHELINSQSFTLSLGSLVLAMKLAKTCTCFGPQSLALPEGAGRIR
jgi:hypothetical protein